MKGRVLIIDDEAAVRKAFGQLLADGGLNSAEAEGGSAALTLLQREEFDLALLDFSMPGLDGLAVLREIRQLDPELPVVMITGYGEVSLVVEAIKAGAYDYLLKPPDPDHLLMTINRALEKQRLRRRVQNLERSLERSLENQLGHSPAGRRIIEEIRRVAPSDFSLVIEGETGTGKTFIAALIHNLSPRTAGPFIALDMGAIPQSLLESELFGHQKGAFTGADRAKKGYFERAQGGTLLLDELQNLSPLVQGKILQVVEERRFYPLGGDRPQRVDIRIIGATNTDLARAVERGDFRRDLYYRLNEYNLKLPPLRERPEDIASLAARIITETATELNRNLGELDEEALALLTAHSWPGNIRELKNLLRRAVLQSPNGELSAAILARVLAAATPEADPAAPSPPAAEGANPVSLDQAEKAAVSQALAHTGGNRTKSAVILGITHKTLLAKIKKYNLG